MSEKCYHCWMLDNCTTETLHDPGESKTFHTVDATHYMEHLYKKGKCKLYYCEKHAPVGSTKIGEEPLAPTTEDQKMNGCFTCSQRGNDCVPSTHTWRSTPTSEVYYLCTKHANESHACGILTPLVAKQDAKSDQYDDTAILERLQKLEEYQAVWQTGLEDKISNIFKELTDWKAKVVSNALSLTNLEEAVTKSEANRIRQITNLDNYVLGIERTITELKSSFTKELSAWASYVTKSQAVLDKRITGLAERIGDVATRVETISSELKAEIDILKDQLIPTLEVVEESHRECV